MLSPLAELTTLPPPAQLLFQSPVQRLPKNRMSKSPTWLLEHSRNDYSQYGEDGIIEQVLGLLPSLDHWCVEFGAWDGQYLSNTYRLTESCNYSAVLIEGSADRAEALKTKYANSSRIFPVNAFVGYSADDNLDSILAKTPLPRNFDLLSIDIDGNDYHVWQASTAYTPKVVVIEFNSTVPTDADFIQPAAPDVSQGCGLRPLVSLGKAKGYELVCVTLGNAIFVRAEYFDRFEITDNRPETLRRDTSNVTWLLSTFDGNVILRGSRRMPWHGLHIRESRVQQVPACFRQYPHNFSRLKSAAFKIYKKYWNSRARRERKRNAAR